MNKVEYNKKIEMKYGKDTFTVIDKRENIRNRDRIKIQCCKCGFIKEVEARSFIRDIKISKKFLEKRKCSNCRKKEIKEKKEIRLSLEEIKNRLSDHFLVLNYRNSKEVMVKCKRCGNVYIGSLVNLEKAKGCSKCSINSVKSIDDMNSALKDKFKDEDYRILSIELSGWKSSPFHKVVKVLYKGKIFKKSFNELLKYGCSREFKRSFEYLNEELKRITNGRYKILPGQKYTTRKAKAKIIDTYTGKIEERVIENFLKNPHFGNRRFSSYAILFFSKLNSEKIFFSTEKRFKGTGNKRFDIEIKNKNILVEIDGEQHFFPIFGKNNVIKEESFQQTRQRDLEKNNFVRETNKILIRISYKNFNSEELISKIVKDIKNLDFESLKSNRDILLIKDKNIFNEKSYYGT